MMKQRMKACIVGVAVGALSATTAAQPKPQIAIKGIRIGMTVAEFERAVPSIASLTIGGVPTRSEPRVSFGQSGGLEEFGWSFTSENFDKVLAAVRWKYPAVRCRDSQMGNKLGAVFTQTECVLDGDNGWLIAARYGASTEFGSLWLISSAKAQEQAAAVAAAMKDI